MLGIDWRVQDGYGWGVFGLNLVLETVRGGWDHPVPLAGFRADSLDPEELRQLEPWARGTPRAAPGQHSFPVLHALGNGLRSSPTPHRGTPDVGVVFFEDTNLTDPAVKARMTRYQGFMAGSRWNAELLSAAGAPAVQATPQGVDIGRFRPRPRQGRWGGRFVVFSGGKLEPRKGQDLTVQAFRAFHARHPEALLVTAWHSPWPALAAEMGTLSGVNTTPGVKSDGRLDVSGWLRGEGLPEIAFVDLGSLSNRETPEILAECDVALLPSRAEGGTNLVAMECLAAGLPTVLSANTGHLDLIDDVPCVSLDTQHPFSTTDTGTEGWGSTDVEEITHALETLFSDAARRAQLGAEAHAAMTRWSWRNRVEALVDAVRDLSVH